MTNDEMPDALKRSVQIVATVTCEHAALKRVLEQQGVLPVQLYEQERDRLLAAVHAATRKAEQAGDAQFLEFLRKFEGPIQ